MPAIAWIGPAAPPAVIRALAARGLTLAKNPARPAATVLATRDAATPRAPAGDASWLWVATRPIGGEAEAEAIRRGAYDAVSLSEESAAERIARRIAELLEPEPAIPVATGMIAESARMRAILAEVARAARTAMPVLVTGETGTGKEQIARLIHAWSSRTGPWVPINCAAIPNELMESELFGHARGAFSGAVASVDGKLLAAQGGTVFLDEIDDTPLPTQMKLLRVLEDGEVTRVGETRARPADFRIVAATNRDLVALAAEGRFGLDLYQRLAIVRIELPRLVERSDDIPALARHFVARFYEQQRTPPRVLQIAPRALEALAAHDWPGNIRELRNVLYHALVRKRAGDELLLSDLRLLLDRRQESRADLVNGALLRTAIQSRSFNLRRAVAELERAALRTALDIGQGSPTRAARLLGEVGRGKSTDPGGTVRAMIKRLAVEAD